MGWLESLILKVKLIGILIIAILATIFIIILFGAFALFMKFLTYFIPAALVGFGVYVLIKKAIVKKPKV